MIKEEGYITYLPKGSDKPVTEKVIYASWFCGDLLVHTDSILEYKFYYQTSTDKWVVPYKRDEEYGTMLYKEFDGKVLKFEYNTYMSLENTK